MHPMLNIAIKAVRIAGNIILKASDNLNDIKIYQKSKKNFVTNIDIIVEQSIINIINKAYKDHYFITEESGKFGNLHSKYTWIIDPIDGTNNFINGLPHNCISIAMQFKGKTKLATVYNPHLDQLFIAEKGNGAQLNHLKTRISNNSNLQNCIISGSIRYNKKVFNSNYYKAIIEFQKKILGLRYSGSLTLDMCYVACGYLDGIWTTHDTKIWDFAGGAIMIEESGGTICDFEGNTVNILNPSCFIGGNHKINEQISKFFTPYLKKMIF